MGKRLPPKVIKDWEEHDAAKDQEVHQYRLQNIALRNRLANCEKLLKKKEQLAEGLHLIDFEQLKIENQTLNEKIEERNEELSRLRRKILTHVVMLSHNREKYQFVTKQNEELQRKLAETNEQNEMVKKKLSSLKKQREGSLKTFQKLKQQTGIVSQECLREDFKNRAQEMIKLEEKEAQLKDKKRMLENIIKEARTLQK